MIQSSCSEAEREAQLNRVFVPAIGAILRAALEGRVFVVEQPLHVLVEIPVQADSVGVGLARGAAGSAKELPPPLKALSSMLSCWHAGLDLDTRPSCLVKREARLSAGSP